MTPNDQPNVSAGPSTPAVPPARNMKFKLAALGLALVSGLAGLGLARYFQAPSTPEIKLPPQLFQGWNTKPDFVLLLSGEQHGYLMPCGCSRPQKGGLERRDNFLQLLKAKGWTVLPVDLGDVPQTHGPAGLPNIQGLIKYKYSMESLKRMGYAAASFGKYEAGLSLDTVFGEWALNEPQPPILSANFAHKEGAYKEAIKPLVITPVPGAGLNVGIGGLTGPMIHEDIEKKDPIFTFATGADSLPNVVKEMADKKADFRVLLYQGDTVHGMKGAKPEVYALIDAFPQFNLILCLSESDEPRSTSLVYKKTTIVNLGHKGRYVGVVGVWKTGQPARPFELKYQFVELDESFLTPENAKEKHRIVALMQQYKQELKDQEYLGKYPQVTHPNYIEVGKGNAPHYVGTESCKGCHSDVYKKWLKTPHSHAYQTLVDAKYPSLNQFDPECIVCHTVGFGYKTGFRDEKTTPKLLNVGCESCHGPASEHREAEQARIEGKQAPLLDRWRAVMNPWRTPDGPEAPADRDKRLLRADTFCRSCHDTDNDVNWVNTRASRAFDRNWMKIWHYQRDDKVAEYTKKEEEAKKEPKEP